MREPINIIKVGGAVVEDEKSLDELLSQFAALPGSKILVHGGGRSATKIAAALGIESHMVGGRRITDSEMLRIVTMVYGGLVNKNIVAKLQARGVNAVGLTGADMNIIRSHRRPPIPLRGEKPQEDCDAIFEKNGQTMVDFGFVGDVDDVDADALINMMIPPLGEMSGGHGGFIPVIAPLTHDGMGNLLNTNADTIAASVAKALSKASSLTERSGGVTLTYCFEKPGVLRDADDDTSVIHQITASSYAQLKADGIVSGGMIPKLDNAFESINAGVSRVVITSYHDIPGSHGTTIIA